MSFTGGGIGSGSIDIDKLTADIQAKLNNAALALVETKELAEAGTTIDFTGLSGDKTYFMIADLEEANAGTKNVYFYVNNDVTDTNYYTQLHGCNDTVVTTGRANLPRIAQIPQATASVITAYFTNDRNGYFTALCQSTNGVVGGVVTFSNMIAHRNTNAGITSVKLVCQAGNLLAGSKASLYEVKH